MMSATAFVDSLSSASFQNSFNPYRDRCAIYDVDEAPAIRRAILLSAIEAAEKRGVDALWIGRDLGHRGGRRTGLALTDDLRLGAYARRWNLDFTRPTKGPPVTERTASVVWDLLGQIPHGIFMWNVFPLHPHEPEDDFSNRQHTRVERAFGIDVLHQLILLLRPQRLVCIGNDAASAVAPWSATLEVVPVRHPSYGGQTIFSEQISALYGVPWKPMAPLLL